jgi:hypothetical protein
VKVPLAPQVRSSKRTKLTALSAGSHSQGSLASAASCAISTLRRTGAAAYARCSMDA